MSISKKNLRALSILVMFVAFIGIILCSTLNYTYADSNILKDGEITIAHITDLHYFAYEDCYLGEEDEYYKTTTFYKNISKDTKLIKQAGTLLNATIQNLLVQKPDYLIVSGDITSNGELKGHMDVANALRYLQNKLRLSGKQNFQVFVVPGNHDLYNNRAAKYINSDNEVAGYKKGDSYNSPDYITTSHDFKVIYNGLGYPALNVAGLQTTNVGQYMLSYFEEKASDDNAYTTQYIYSPLASNVAINYFSSAYGLPTETNRLVGALSYIAEITDAKYAFTMIDATEREKVETRTNSNTHEMICWNQLTGGRITMQMQAWLKENTESIRQNKKTNIGSVHFNVVPHYTLEENYTKDFTLYNWEDSAHFLADELGIRYFFTGHMHSSDRAQFVTYKGNVLQDFETGSLVSLHSPTRYTKIQRYKYNDTVFEDVFDTVSTINSLKEVKSVKINEEDQIAQNAFFNEIDDLEKTIGAEIYDRLVVRLLDGFVNASLENTIVGLLNGLDISGIPFVGEYNTAIKQLAKTVINQIFYDLDYNIDGIKADDIFEFVRGAVYKSDTLNMVVYEEAGQVFTLEKVLLNAYKSHLMGNEPEMFDSSTVEGRACIKANEGLLDGSIVEKLLNGLLKPLLYADNSVIKQLVEYKFDVSSCTDPKFDNLVSLFISYSSPNHPKNNGRTLKINDILDINPKGTLYIALMALLPANIADIVNDIKENGVPNWCESMLDKYLTDSFYKGIGGLLSETYESFALDKMQDSKSYVFDGKKISDDMWTKVVAVEKAEYTYNGAPLTLEQNKPTYEDGRLPSLLTSTFGDDPATSQNFKWQTNHRVGGKLIYREVGQKDYITATVTTKIVPQAVPLIDLGLFATTTETKYEIDGVEYEFDYNNLEERDMEGLTSSVKFFAIHSVTLENLKPNTVYEYKVIGTYEEQEFVVSSDPYTFKTALKKGDEAPFSIMAISDIQGTIKSSYELAYKALSEAQKIFKYDFIINCGDVVDNGKNIKQWSYAQNVLAPIFANSSTVVAAGNHEKDSNALATYYNFGGIGNKEAQDTTSGVYYSFNYGSVHFVVLNTNDSSSKGLGKAQLNWLKKDLEKANEDSAIKDIVVCMHKSLYSIGSHVEDKDILAMKEQLVPIFAEQKVSLVLAGHDHTYSTTHYLDKDGKVAKKLSVKNGAFKTDRQVGVIYMTLGTIADKYYEYTKVKETEKLLSNKNTIYAQLDAPMMTNITFTAQGATVEGYAYHNGKIVSLKTYKNYIENKIIIPLVIVSIVLCIGFAVLTYFAVISKNFVKTEKDIDLNI